MRAHHSARVGGCAAQHSQGSSSAGTQGQSRGAGSSQAGRDSRGRDLGLYVAGRGSEGARKGAGSAAGDGLGAAQAAEVVACSVLANIDCSVSGISGHGDKIDYGFFKENGKFFTQLLAMVEVKNVFGESDAVKAEALGQLVASREAVFRKQPGRTHVMGAAVARDSVDIVVMHGDGRVWHTGHHSFEMGQVSSGLEWLLRLLLATPAAMGFRSTVLPVIPALSSGATIHNMRLVYYDSSSPAQRRRS